MKSATLILDAFWVDNKTFPTEQLPNSHYGRIFHDYYDGNARHLGWMDLVLLKNLIKKHNISHIILQNLDSLGKIAEVTRKVDVCVAYTYKKHFMIPSVKKEKDLKNCEPVYQTVIFGGWNISENDTEICERAQHYMRYLLVHTRVNSITAMTNNIKVTLSFDQLGRIVTNTEPN